MAPTWSSWVHFLTATIESTQQMHYRKQHQLSTQEKDLDFIGAVPALLSHLIYE